MIRDESLLLLIARLRGELRAARERGELSAAELEKIARALDVEGAKRLEALPEVSLAELLGRAEDAELEVDLEPLRSRLRQGDLERIRLLREASLSWGRDFLDLDDVYPGIRRIPLGEFAWKSVEKDFDALVALLRDPDRHLEEAVAACRRFFQDGQGFSVPALLPTLSRGLVQRLIKRQTVEPEMAGVLTNDLRILENHERISAGQLGDRLRRGSGLEEPLDVTASDAAYHFLSHRAAAMGTSPSLSLDALVVQWSGPGFADLAVAWLRPRRPANLEQRFRRANLAFARTGVDPLEEPEAWRDFLTETSSKERQDRGQLMAEIAHYKTFYELGLVLSAEPLLGEAITERWWPALEILRMQGTQPIPVSLEGTFASLKPAPSPAEPSPAEPSPASDEPRPDDDLDLVPEDEPEFVEAVPARMSAEDRLVEEKSAWNVYLKPFLSENWLGLMGVVSLMAAWAFLTLYLWDRGQAFRVAMGVVPLLGLTVGAAGASRFVRGLEGASPRAAGLFASLAFLAVPFNFALGASLVGRSGLLNAAFGFSLAGFYGVFLPWIGRRIAPSLGHDPWPFLLVANTLVYLPATVVFLLGLAAVPSSLAATLFLSYGALLFGWSRAAADGARWRLVLPLYGAVFLLVNAIPAVFFRGGPPTWSFAVFLVMLAPALTFFGRHRPAAVATAGGVAALGVLVSFGAVAWMPVVLVLATAFWYRERRHLEKSWPDEVVAIHLLALAASLAWVLDLAWGAWPLAFVPALVAIRLLERGHPPTETLSYSLPLFQIGTVLAGREASTALATIAAPLVFAAAFVFAYDRYARGARPVFWSFHLALGVGLLGVALRIDDGPVAKAALFTAGVATAWAVVSPRLGDAFTKTHRTLILWILAAGAAGAVISASVATDSIFDPLFAAAAGLTFATLGAAAFWSQATLPIYAALFVAAALRQRLRLELGLGERTGFGTALTGAALLVAAEVTGRFSFWRRDPAGRLFGYRFPGHSNMYLPHPLRVAALLVVTVGAVFATFGFAALVIDPRSALVYILAAFVFARLAWRLEMPVLGGIALVPIGAFLATLIGSFPFFFWGHAILAVLTGLEILRRRLGDGGTAARRAVVGPYAAAVRFLVLAAVPASFAAYVPAALGGWAEVVSLALLAVAFAHVFVVRERTSWHPAVWLHVVAGWTVGFLVAVDVLRLIDDLGDGSYLFWTGLFVLIFAPALVLERSSRSLARTYAKGAQPWLWLAAIAFTASGLLFRGGASTPRWPDVVYPAASWLLLLLGNRQWRSRPMVILRGLASLAIVWVVVPEPVAASFLGLVLFYALELLVGRLDGVVGGRLLATPFAERQGDDPRATAITLHVLGGLVVAVHLAAPLLRDAAPAFPQHFWLYGLIPFCWLVFRNLGRPYLEYVGFGLFAYANAFYAVELLPWARGHELTALHLVGLAFVVSMGCYVVLGRRLGRRFDRLERGTLS